MRFTSKKIGSRNFQTTIYWNNEKNHVVCGCFNGNLKEFKEKVYKTNGDNEYGIQYKKLISFVENMIKSYSEL